MKISSLLLLTAIFPKFWTPSLAQTDSGNQSKRGLPYQPTSHDSDYDILLSTSSPLIWYYNWSPYPSLPGSHLDFIPMLHGISSLDSDISAIQSLPANTHLLTFNEPNGSTQSGGSDISPQDAAKAYIDSVLPLRSGSQQFLLSQPSVSGSSNGLDWLDPFNESCYKLNPKTGCTADFVAVHWYGDFPGLASWLGTLHARQPNIPIWITEFALPQASLEATVGFLNQSLPYLDTLKYIERYAWFGAFRDNVGNEWTGDKVALWDSNGGLSQIGSLYLGGPEKGFSIGATSASGGRHVGSPTWVAVALTAFLAWAAL